MKVKIFAMAMAAALIGCGGSVGRVDTTSTTTVDFEGYHLVASTNYTDLPKNCKSVIPSQVLNETLTLKREDGPYCSTGDIVINAHGKLSIEPNTELIGINIVIGSSVISVTTKNELQVFTK